MERARNALVRPPCQRSLCYLPRSFSDLSVLTRSDSCLLPILLSRLRVHSFSMPAFSALSLSFLSTPRSCFFSFSFFFFLVLSALWSLSPRASLLSSLIRLRYCAHTLTFCFILHTIYLDILQTDSCQATTPRQKRITCGATLVPNCGQKSTRPICAPRLHFSSVAGQTLR